MAVIMGSQEHREVWELRHQKQMDPAKHLCNYLRMYYHGAVDRLQLKLTLKDVDATGGKELNPTAVGRWEVECALERLHELDSLQYAAIRLSLEFGFGWRRIGREIGRTPGEAHAAFNTGVSWLVDHIYDWTPGGIELARQAEEERTKAADRR